ncbi:hypothetical protein ACFQLX_09735 [Streptomyces polyrhachis]|uniref:Helix-turn-helix transcriptional regulator n=1 Tax=Streptomyces polyrhachis TaxID=1282885 RepID=A0ABW2GFM8_9ACTN
MAGLGSSVSDDPLERAIWRLRSRACWDDAAALLEPRAAREAGAALWRAALLVERCMYTSAGWQDAEDALRLAESLATDDEERGAAASERGYLVYGSTLFQGRDRSDEARAALGRAAALLAPGAAARPLLDYRRGLVAQHLTRHADAAEAAFRRAQAGAVARGDLLLRSSTSRHLAALAAEAGELAEAREGFAESLRIREELGYLVGTAPALMALADVEPEPQAARLRAEAARLVQLLGGVPLWLAKQLGVPQARR